MRILCVDDDPVILRLFERSLAKIDLPDYHYLSTSTGNEAVTIATTTPVDLVLLDNILPDIRGLEVLEKIKAVRPGIEILMITGHASVADAVAAMKNGARDYIEKPFHLDLLREKIYNLVEYRLRNREAEDYRFAKEVVENDAGTQISSLETFIDNMKKCRSRVIAILESDRSDADKLKSIRSEISDSTGGC
ncbi:MAG: response regulator [Chitinispirillaceae bacterium]|nr:response regulator [Chitinispirillaceae bacterium]